MNDRTSFAYYETEAQRLATRIRDLKALTPEFTEVRDQAQRQMQRHFELIEQEEKTLADLRKQAAEAAMLLGAEVEEVVANGVVEQAQAYNRYLHAGSNLLIETENGFVPLVGSVEEQRQIEAILNDDTPFRGIANDPPPTFATLGDVANEITAAIAEMAGDQPDAPDQSDGPELTTEQTETVEMNMAAPLKAYA